MFGAASCAVPSLGAAADDHQRLAALAEGFHYQGGVLVGHQRRDQQEIIARRAGGRLEKIGIHRRVDDLGVAAVILADAQAHVSGVGRRNGRRGRRC